MGRLENGEKRHIPVPNNPPRTTAPKSARPLLPAATNLFRAPICMDRYVSLLERGSNRAGKYDHGEIISLPVGKTITSKQVEEVAAAIHQRQEEMVPILEEETTK